MEIQLEIGITCLLLVALAFVATVDMAFGQLSDVGLRRLITEREERQRRDTTFLSEILEDRPRFRFTLNAVIQVMVVAVAVLVTSVSYRLFGEQRRFLLIAFFMGLALTIVFRQIIPRLLAKRNPEGTLLALLPLLRPFYGALSLAATQRQSAADRARRADPHVTQTAAEAAADEDDEDDGSDLQALIEVGEEEGILEEEERERIQNIIEFGETRAGEIM
nr:CNNM domain-containing protein [Acidobacteriota bacterium]